MIAKFALYMYGRLCAKVQIQERLLGLVRREPCVVYAREHALVRRLVRMEHKHAGVEGELEASVEHVWDGGEREGQVEELVKVLSSEGVRIDVDHAVDPEEVVERPEVQLGVLIDEAVADTCAVVGWWDALDQRVIHDSACPIPLAAPAQERG